MMEIDPLRFRLNLHAAKAGGVHLFSHSLGSGRLIVDYQVHVESAEAQTATCRHVAVPFKDSKVLMLMRVPRPVLLPAVQQSSPRSSSCARESRPAFRRCPECGAPASR